MSFLSMLGLKARQSITGPPPALYTCMHVYFLHFPNFCIYSCCNAMLHALVLPDIGPHLAYGEYSESKKSYLANLGWTGWVTISIKHLKIAEGQISMIRVFLASQNVVINLHGIPAQRFPGNANAYRVHRFCNGGLGAGMWPDILGRRKVSVSK